MPTLCQHLDQNLANHPDRIILRLLSAGQPDQALSYAEFIQGAVGYSHALAEAGIQPGEVVILVLQHGVDLIYGFWGAILHGAIPSIMPFLTEKLSPERYQEDMAALLKITRPAALITYPDFYPVVMETLHAGDSVRAVLVTSNTRPGAGADLSGLSGFTRQPEDIVLLQHSSGTTGLQKGVALSHQAVLNQLESYSQAIHLKTDDVVVSWLPLYHDMGLIAGFIMPILWGIPLVMMSPFDWVRAPYRLMQAISRYQGTLTWLPNFAYNFCSQKIRARDLEGVDLSSLRGVINCSEPMRWESHQLFIDRFQPYGLRVESLKTCYAMAENVFAVTQGGFDAAVVVDEIDQKSFVTERVALPSNQAGETLKMLSAGRPISKTRVKVVDDRGLAITDRQVGEIALYSNCMLTGYYRRDDITQKAFIDGWYLTGDLGYMAGGEVYVVGRKKDLIIVGGKNIYPQDLEAIANQVPGVHPGRVVAFGVFNPELGTEDVAMVAEVDTDDKEARERIADEIRQRVTRGSAVALRQVLVVGPKWIIKTSSGKIARPANRDKYLAVTAASPSAARVD
jgi:acyl-CoA synthetase (AMP-forming)/AMP-acid ligase II